MTNAVSNTSISIRTTAATTSPMTSPDGPAGSGLGSTGGDVIVSGGSCKTCLTITPMSAILSLISRLCPRLQHGIFIKIISLVS